MDEHALNGKQNWKKYDKQQRHTRDGRSTHFLMLTMVVEVIDDRFYEDAAGLLSFESILFDAKKRTTMR